MFASTAIVRDSMRAGRPTCLIITDDGVFWPLTRYFRRRNFSLSSERGYALAVSRAMNWTSARWPTSTPSSSDRLDAFGHFTHDLLGGTIADGDDPSGLWWLPSSSKTVRITARRVGEFGDWLALSGEGDSINPATRNSSATERLTLLRAAAKFKSCSMLAHAISLTKAKSQASKTHEVWAPGRNAPVVTEIAAFPVERVRELLFEGFEYERFKSDPRPWIRYKLRDMLITLICLYGGTRMSEPMHLWVDDVFESAIDPLSCKILIHSPEEGVVDFQHPVTGQSGRTSRLDYLNRFCDGKRPLTMETGRRRAGWKGCLLTNRERKAFEVFWIDSNAGALFLDLWRLYLTKVRQPQENTPWAFLTKDGQPMGTAAYADSLRAAVRKIGLTSAKWSGTTPHGLRHAYGQQLNESGMDEKSGQVAMHHCHPGSQAVYREVSSAQVAQALSTAMLSRKSVLPTGLQGANDEK